MKAISGHINRGTELLKQTVQKAILSTLNSEDEPSYAIRPTCFHALPTAGSCTDGRDSIQIEMCHIRPIRAFTVTPRHTNTELMAPTPRYGAVNNTPNRLAMSKVKIPASSNKRKGTPSAFCALTCPKVERAPQRKTRDKSKSGVGDKSPAVSPANIKKVLRGHRQKPVKKPVDCADTSSSSVARKRCNRRDDSLESERQQRTAQMKNDFEMAKQLQREFDLSDSQCTHPNSVNGPRRTRSSRINGSKGDGGSLHSTTIVYPLRSKRSLSNDSVDLMVIDDRPRKRRCIK